MMFAFLQTGSEAFLPFTILFGFGVICCVVYFFLTDKKDGPNMSTPEDLQKLDKNAKIRDWEGKVTEVKRQQAVFTAYEEKVKQVDRMDNLGTRLQEEEKIKQKAAVAQELTHKVSIEASNSALELIGYSKEEKIDVPTYLDIKKAERLQALELEKKNEEDKLQRQRQNHDIQVQIGLAMAVEMKDKQKVLHIQEEVLKLIDKGQQIKNHPTDSEEVKAAKLEVVNEVIKGLREDMRGLLQTPDQQRIEKHKDGSDD